MEDHIGIGLAGDHLDICFLRTHRISADNFAIGRKAETSYILSQFCYARVRTTWSNQRDMFELHLPDCIHIYGDAVEGLDTGNGDAAEWVRKHDIPLRSSM